MNEATSADRHKLGLALAGGGFRASLFHVGVLRRMAELDLLREVEVISTVSGGSIVGALFVLLLRERLNAKARLSREEYQEIVDETHRILVKGVCKNLRMRLLMNPLGVLRVLLTHHSLGKRMARLYERHIYSPVIRPRTSQEKWIAPGRILLKDVRFTPGGHGVEGGLEHYNADEKNTSKIPNLILNATSLNSGALFRFSSVEVGDWRLGFFREDEVETELEPRRPLLQEVRIEDFERVTELRQPVPDPESRTVTVGQRPYPLNRVRFAYWWRTRENGAFPLWLVTPLADVDGFPGLLTTAAFGLLRQAKLAAWYLRRGRTHGVDGGVRPEIHLRRFWEALRLLDGDLAETLFDTVKVDPPLGHQLMDFVLELYYQRSAEVMSASIRKDWNNLTLGEAVGASACFPPVFPPLVMLGWYDDLWVSRLGLTDGGVFDNTGLTTLLDEGCTHIIASDTSGLFSVTQRAARGRLGMSARLIGIFMADIAGWQRQAVRERRRVSAVADKIEIPAETRCERLARAEGEPRAKTPVYSPTLPGVVRAKGPAAPEPAELVADLKAAYQLRGLAFFQTNSIPPPWQHGDGPKTDRNLVGELRTDLDVFGEVEEAALVNQGYQTAHLFLHKYLSKPPSPYVANFAEWHDQIESPIPIKIPIERTRKILKNGQSLFLRALWLPSWLIWFAWLGHLLALVLLFYWSRPYPLSVAGVIQAWADLKMFLTGLLPSAATALIPQCVRSGWHSLLNLQTNILEWFLNHVATLGRGIVAATLVVAAKLLARKAWPKFIEVSKRRYRQETRTLVTVVKWARSLALNVLWLVGGAPIWISLATAIVAWFEYIFDTIPFREATRNR